MRYLSPLVLLMCASACTGTETLVVKSIYGNAQCGDAAASMRIIEAAHLAALMGQNRLQQPWGEKPAAPPDTGDRLLVLISLGQKPSGGYGLALTGVKAVVDQGVVLLPLLVQEPPPDSLQTQHLTQPCLVVGLQPGNYRQVQSAALPGLAAQVDE
jgi:hypothetical protein